LSAFSPARLFGPPPVDRLAHTTFLSSASDAFVAVSLAGSLFFNLSIDAARPRIILYLVVTMAPFAVVAPLIGPFVDRVRGGHRMVIAAACLGRFVLILLLSRDLRSLLLYPEVFTILVLNKTHSVAKSALVPRLVAGPEDLVRANSTLSRTAVVAGAVGGSIAVAILGMSDAATVLRVGAVGYALALVSTLRIPRSPAVQRSPASLVAEAQELRAPSLRLGLSSMALIRGIVGFFAFFAAFTLKSAGEPTWVFGAVAVAGGVGGFLATFVAPALRRLFLEERILELALVIPAVLAIVVPKGSVGPALVIVAFGLGVAANLGRQAFDSLVQRDAPDAERGRTFAGFEARLQLAWVFGALIPVLVLPGSTLGLFLAAGVLLVGAFAYGTTARSAVRRGWGEWSAAVVTRDFSEEDPELPLAEQLLETARWLAARGAHRQAVAVAATALEALDAQSGPGPVDPGTSEVAELVAAARVRVLAGDTPDADEVDVIVTAVAELGRRLERDDG